MIDGETRTVFYRGVSMRRTFRLGDQLRTESVPFELIRPGDIVTFLRTTEPNQTETVVHRVIAVRRGSILTRGDNSPRPDPPVTADQDVRRVVGVIRREKVRRITSGRLGMILFHVRQGRRILRRILAPGVNPILRLAPLRGLAPLLGRPEFARFADRDLLFLHGKPLAVRPHGNQHWVIPDAVNRLFFSPRTLTRFEDVPHADQP